MNKIKLFLASSSELREDRERFEIFIRRKNDDWVDKGVYLRPILWEDFLDALSPTRLQDEYNKSIRECDVFVMLFFTKVGKYTEEEFDTAVGQFKATNKPFIYTIFKNAKTGLDSSNNDDQKSLSAFKKKLSNLGHFYTRYENIEGLLLKFDRQLERLAAMGFLEFNADEFESDSERGASYDARLTGDRALAQGAGATSVGARAVYVGRDSSGNINTGTQIDTGGAAIVGGDVRAGGDFVGRDKRTYGIPASELEPLFASLRTVVEDTVAADNRDDALRQVELLKAELGKGEQADDKTTATVIERLVDMVPEAIRAVVSMFATPILSGIAGNATQYVLDKIRGR